MSTTRADVEDVDFVDAVELLSTGASPYKSGVSVVAATNSSSQITISTTGPLNLDGFVYGDDPVESGDRITIAGSSAADGSYTIDVVIDNNTISTIEAIPNSTGGVISVAHPSGASRVGIDTSSLSNSSATTLQQTLVDIDVAVGTGGGVNANDEGVAVPNTPHTTFNFVGAGVTAVDGGGGVVDVTIPGGGGASDIQHSTFDVVFPEGHDEVLGTVTGLSAAPLKVMPSEPVEIGTSVWNGVRWALAITNLTSDGFDWALRILDEANWAGPGSTTVRVPYIWTASTSSTSSAIPSPSSVGQLLYSPDGANWTAAHPVVNISGIIMVDNNDNIIVTGA